MRINPSIRKSQSMDRITPVSKLLSLVNQIKNPQDISKNIRNLITQNFRHLSTYEKKLFILNLKEQASTYEELRKPRLIVQQQNQANKPRRTMNADEVKQMEHKNDEEFIQVFAQLLHLFGSLYFELDKSLAIDLLQYAANANNPSAIDHLAYCYTTGNGLGENLELAFKYAQLAYFLTSGSDVYKTAINHLLNEYKPQIFKMINQFSIDYNQLSLNLKSEFTRDGIMLEDFEKYDSLVILKNPVSHVTTGVYKVETFAEWLAEKSTDPITRDAPLFYMPNLN